MPRVKFTKMHGLGNDYVYVDARRQRIDDAPALARAVSCRHTGIGSDGLILIGSSDIADVRMEMYNADGSRAEMCGNGIRCVAKYAVEKGMAGGPELAIETDAGVKQTTCLMSDGCVHAVRVDMGVPDLHPSALPSSLEGDRVLDREVSIDESTYILSCVSMGNPHAVVFVDDLDEIDLPRQGRAIETAPCFPKRINVHFVRVQSRDHVVVRTWERGSGETKACGTGACAVCVATALTGRTDRQITTTLPGGDLLIEWADNNHVYMTGPAIEVFSGEWRTDPFGAKGVKRG